MIKEKAYAKLNLNLHILPDLKFKKETGYYPVKFINCELDLHDDIFIENKENAITLTCDNKELSNTENLAYKAAFFLKKELDNPRLGVNIVLKKRIPVKAGFGGGSSDAAVILRTLIKLWNVHPSTSQLTKIIGQLGSDVYYSMKGGLCEVGGKGEQIKKFKSNLPVLWMVLIIPEISKPSTGWIYGQINRNNIGLSTYKYDQLKSNIENKKKKELLSPFHNDFEDVLYVKYPKLLTIQKDMVNSGSIKELVAGSGLSIVGFYPSKITSDRAFQELKIKYKNCIWTHTR